MKNNLTFEQVREAKDRLEEAVFGAAQAFETKTGLQVTSLGLNSDYRQVGQVEPKFHLTAREGGLRTVIAFGEDNFPF